MRKILLCCAGGMSSSLLVLRMRQAAEQQNYECEIETDGYMWIEKKAKDADVLLVGPQIRHHLQNLRKQISCPVEVIDMKLYGTMDGAGVLEVAKKILND